MSEETATPLMSKSNRARNGDGRNGSPYGGSASSSARPESGRRTQYGLVSLAFAGILTSARQTNAAVFLIGPALHAASPSKPDSFMVLMVTSSGPRLATLVVTVI